MVATGASAGGGIVQVQARRAPIRSLVTLLNPTQNRVAYLLSVEGLNRREAAIRIGLSEQRVGQILLEIRAVYHANPEMTIVLEAAF